MRSAVFSEEPVGEDMGRSFYLLRVCKSCRADWMAAIREWFENPVERGSCGSGIFVREGGAARELTVEEWDERYPGRVPVRFKDNVD